MEAEYLHAIRIQALCISSAAGIGIRFQVGTFCRDDALRPLRALEASLEDLKAGRIFTLDEVMVELRDG